LTTTLLQSCGIVVKTIVLLNFIFLGIVIFGDREGSHWDVNWLELL